MTHAMHRTRRHPGLPRPERKGDSRPRRLRRLTPLLVAVALPLIPRADACAQGALVPDARGVSLSVHTYRHFLAGVDERPESPDDLVFEDDGRGLVLGVGYTFTPAAHLRLQLQAAGHETNVEDVNAARITALLELHYRLAAGSRVRPVLMAGLGATGVGITEESYDASVHGLAASTGFGILAHLSTHWSLELMTRVDLINWEETRVVIDRGEGVTETTTNPVEEDGAAASISFGVVWQL